MGRIDRLFYWLNLPAKDYRPLWMDLIPVLAIAVSAGVAIFVMLSTRRFTRQQADLAYSQKILPNLVFLRRGTQIWTLKNVGEGTAFAVNVFNYANGVLVNKVVLYPIMPKEAIGLTYLRGADRLVVEFINMYGAAPAHTICEGDSNKYSKGVFQYNETPSAVGHESQQDQWRTERTS